MATYLIVISIVLVLGYLLLRFNTVWIFRVLDRALRNDRTFLPREYELPRYFKLTPRGDVDPSVRWPGWDGWYFFMVPEGKTLPVKMVRASLMTGLYGLDGIDDYEKLRGLSAFQAVEHLTLIPTEESLDGRAGKENHLSQHYLPKATDLMMEHENLNVTITTAKVENGEETELYGRISGAWPAYEFCFVNPDAEIRVELSYRGENIVWWADLPNIFTYFATFGRFDGKVSYRRGASAENAHRSMEKEEVYAVKGRGCFEHGFARKPFNFDWLWLPIRLLKKLFPFLRPVRYHYELLIGDKNHHGGFMHARGFGIDFRNHGGLYLNGSYRRIKRVAIEYLDEPKPDLVTRHRSGRAPVTFYRAWRVKAVTDDGILEYTGTREWPPASIASNMIYYHFSYAGSYNGQQFSGRGYGEYVHI